LIQRCYLCFSTSPIGQRQFEITLFFQPQSDILPDAADIKVGIPNQLFEILNIKNGMILAQCPKNNIDLDFLNVTCVKPLEDNINFEKTASYPLLSFEIYLKSPYNRGTISLFSESTKLFFQGKQIPAKFEEKSILISDEQL